MRRRSRPRADYGIDAPPVIRNLLLAGLASIAVGRAVRSFLTARQPLLATLAVDSIYRFCPPARMAERHAVGRWYRCEAWARR
jgi:hypothetical protein